MNRKVILFSILCLFSIATLFAQAPQAINSQAVLRNASGRIIANQPVGVRITIAQGSPTGTAVYVETHAVTTNDNGLYTITIGAGTPVTGTFASIDWGAGPYFITSDTDPAGGTNYTITTCQQFLSVPYALFVDTAARVAQASTAVTANNALHADSADVARNAHSSDHADYADTALYYQEQQVISRSGDTIFLTGGSYVVLPLSNCYASCFSLDSLRRVLDTMIHVYDSLSRRLAQRIDSVSAANPANPCMGHSSTGTDNQSACETYTWIDGNTYTSSTTTPTHTITGGSVAGCDSTVTLHLTINHGTHNAESQSAAGSYTWHGTTYSATGTYTYNYTNTSGCASVDTLHLTIYGMAGCECSGTIAVNGVLPGVFSVSATKQVKFSQGNLQYTTTGTHQCADGTTKPGTWRFAECQCQYVGDSNSNISSTYEGWIDIFGWATSGYHDNSDPHNTKYQPYDIGQSATQTNNRFGYGPSTNMTDASLVGTSRYYDWGVYNAISNGGNTAGMWRTLTKDEWTYLTQTRSTTSIVGGTSNARYCKAVVSGVKGLILFPDNYVHPTGVPVPSNINQSNGAFSATFTSSQWGSMESAGCVFLPAAGWHTCDGSVGGVGSSSSYWSTTPYVSGYAWRLDLISSGVRVGYGTQCDGESVRLVQDL